MLVELTVLVILALAAYRLTRFLVIDTLFEGSRAKAHTYMVNKQGKLQFFWLKTLEAVSCTWCSGFWISLTLYSFYLWECPISFSRLDWISVLAIAGVQGFLHALEPDSD